MYTPVSARVHGFTVWPALSPLFLYTAHARAHTHPLSEKPQVRKHSNCRKPFASEIPRILLFAADTHARSSHLSRRKGKMRVVTVLKFPERRHLFWSHRAKLFSAARAQDAAGESGCPPGTGDLPLLCLCC